MGQPHRLHGLFVTAEAGTGNAIGHWIGGCDNDIRNVKNASRWCHNDEVWDNLTDYTACLSQPRSELEMPSDTGLEVATTIYAMFKNASRWCHNDGVWDNLTDYTACLSQPRPELEMPSDTGVEVATTIYAVGYSVSLMALAVAVWIFIFFK
ncbi:hypothetical protein J6590_078185 [Homalodisca vitripennis]|nr:hypothetical protein J6590_078185 [Homalodisca vitripennis]